MTRQALAVLESGGIGALADAQCRTTFNLLAKVRLGP